MWQAIRSAGGSPDHRTATAVIRIADPAARGPTPQSAPSVARPEPRRRAQPDRPRAIALVIPTSRHMTSRQEPATELTGCEATKP